MRKSTVTIYVLFLLIFFGCSAQNTIGKSAVASQPSTIITLNTVTPSSRSIVTMSPTNTETVAVNVTPAGKNANSAVLYRVWRDDGPQGGIFIPETGEMLVLDNEWIPDQWSPDGQKLLLTNENGELFVSDCLGRNPQKIDMPDQNKVLSTIWLTEETLVATTQSSEAHWFTFLIDITKHQSKKMGPEDHLIEGASPTGDFWLMAGAGDLVLVQPDGSTITTIIPYSPRTIGTERKPFFAFLPDGTGLFFIRKIGPYLGTVMFASVANETIQSPVVFLDGISGGSHVYGVSPNGKYLAIVTDSTELYLLNLQTKTIDYHWDWPGRKENPPPFEWSPDSKYLVMAPDQGTGLLSLNIYTGQIQPLLPKPDPKAVYDILDWKTITCKK
jgi:hypothetical protein